MAPRNDEDLERLERALAEAHRSGHEPELGRDWARQVMQDVRRELAGRRHPGEFPGIDRLVWRSAVVAVGFAIILAGAAALYVGTEPVEFAALVAEEVDVIPAFGE